MKVRIKKRLIKESNGQGTDLGYTDIENARIINGMLIDRSVLTPDDGSETKEPSGDRAEPTQKDYINRIRDVVKGGRKIPYLYYAYKGVDENGNLKNDNDITPVLELQIKKAVNLATELEYAGDASVDIFKADFGLLLTLHDEWDKKYEQRMKDLLPSRTYDRLAMKKGYDRAEFQAGRDTNIKPFSTVAIGRGSKPLFAQNVDFMYKTSPEPNKNVDPNDLWAFSIRIPLYLAYTILTRFDYPRGRKTREQRQALADERYKNINPKKIADAYGHWNQNEESYRLRYAQIMKQEPNSWSEYVDAPTIAKNIRLTFDQFNANYVESKRTAVDKSPEYEPHWIQNVGADFMVVAKLLQPPPLRQGLYESILDSLNDPEISKSLAKSILRKMTREKNNELKTNIGKNLQILVQNYGNEPEVKKNLPWLQEAIQLYYIMGGQ